MHLVGFILRIYPDARSPERQTPQYICNISASRHTCISVGPDMSGTVSLPKLSASFIHDQSL